MIPVPMKTAPNGPTQPGPPQPEPTESGPTVGRRVACGLAALATLGVGGAALFGLIVLDDATRAPHAFGGAVPALAFGIVILATALGFGAWLGLAVVPRSVVARGQRLPFVAGIATLVLGLVLAIPTPLALFTWPLALACGVGAVLLLRNANRSMP